MIFVELGKVGRAKIARPTILEVVALVVFLAFAGVAVWALR
jgi:hypothetical protein